MATLTTPVARSIDLTLGLRSHRQGARELRGSSLDTAILRRWIAQQATRYNDLLASIAAAPKPPLKRPG